MRRLVLLFAALLAVLFGGVSVYAGGTTAERTAVAVSVTTNTTSDAIKLPAGIKTFYGEVVGTGAVTQTQAIKGGVTTTAADAITLCTITLSGTTRAQDTCPPITANFLYYFVTTTATTGTAATGAVYAIY